MRKRMWIMLAAMGAFVLAIGGYKVLQIRTAMAQGASWRPPPEAVTTIVARAEPWARVLTPIGTVSAVRGVMVSADMPGMVESITFESGHDVRTGDVLVRLDTKQERAQLAAAEAQRDLARLNAERSRKLLEQAVISQADFDRSEAEYKQADARVEETRAVIARKQIRAPFSGRLGIRKVNLGQYLAGGDPVVTLQSIDPVYVNFTVPQQQQGELRIGAPVKLSADSVAGLPVGRITAINSEVDPDTRNVQAQASFDNRQGKLRPGMFVNVEVDLGEGAPVVTLPATAINYAPYGNSVFVLADMKAPDGTKYRGVQQRFVKLGPGRGDQIAVVSGVQPGDEVVTSGVFKLRNGAAVVVNNAVQPSNDPDPKPEDS